MKKMIYRDEDSLSAQQLDPAFVEDPLIGLNPRSYSSCNT
jgi:hypothetical protein